MDRMYLTLESRPFELNESETVRDSGRRDLEKQVGKSDSEIKQPNKLDWS